MNSQAAKELLRYLDCPSKEVYEETRALLHKQLTEVKDGWLMAGLLEYFLESSSSQVLDLVLNAPEHHDRHFLQLVAEGLRQPQHRFQYSCLLFYGLRRSPAPSWMRRLPRHQALRELLQGLDNRAEATSLVAGVLVVLVLVTAASHDVSRYCLPSVLEMFWRLTRWTPQRPQDESLTDFLRVTLYSLFTRLYALFPCNVVNFVRSHTVGHHDKDRHPFFTSTLQPMIERVRLHPMLFTHTKELEIEGSHTATWDTIEAMQKCARFSLDPMESDCEDPPFVIDPEVCTAAFVEGGKCWLHNSSDNFFWSPSHTQSPNPSHLDLPSPALQTPIQTPLTTPIYSRTPLRLNVSLPIPESPPEAAVEATPETTPFTTPLLSDINRHLLAQTLNGHSSTAGSMKATSSVSVPVTPAAIQSSTLPTMDGCEVSKTSVSDPSKKQSVIVSRLHAMRRERRTFTELDRPALTAACSQHTSDDAAEDIVVRNNEGGLLHDEVPASHNEELSSHTASQDPLASATNKSGRARKKSVYVLQPVDLLEFANAEQTNGEATATETTSDARQLSEEDADCCTRRVSTETNGSSEDGEDEGGLGAPPVTSLNELVRTAKSNRLRFLSQCGPPLDIAQISSILPEKCKRKKKAESRRRTRSNSCCSLLGVNLISDTAAPQDKKELLALCGGRCVVSKVDAETQTQASTVVDPYEKLTETFLSSIIAPSQVRTDGAAMAVPSPHALLEDYLRRKVIDFSEPLHKFDPSFLQNADDRLKSQLHAMFSLLLLERQKRETHAARTRRLLATRKQVHVLYAQQQGLAYKMEAYLEETRNLRLANLYSSSCTQRMEAARDRDTAEKEAVIREYSQGRQVHLCGSVVTSLHRSVRTSKGDETKEKVVVILHRPDQGQDDRLTDALVKYVSALTRNLRLALDDSAQLRLRVSTLEQAGVRSIANEQSLEQLQQEREEMRHHMAVMKIQLTLREELNLEAMERVHSLEQTAFDAHAKHEQHRKAWEVQEEHLIREARAMRGIVGATVLRLRQLEGSMREQDAEHELAMSRTAQANELQRNAVVSLQTALDTSNSRCLDLQMRLRRVEGERDMLQQELHLLAGRSGYSRAASANDVALPNDVAATDSYLSRAASNDLRPLGAEASLARQNKK